MSTNSTKLFHNYCVDRNIKPPSISIISKNGKWYTTATLRGKQFISNIFNKKRYAIQDIYTRMYEFLINMEVSLYIQIPKNSVVLCTNIDTKYNIKGAVYCFTNAKRTAQNVNFIHTDNYNDLIYNAKTLTDNYKHVYCHTDDNAVTKILTNLLSKDGKIVHAYPTAKQLFEEFPLVIGSL